MRVVMIMPFYNEARHLPLVLESIDAQHFPHDQLALVAIDGHSNDASLQIVRAWAARTDIDARILTNSRRRIPISLNLGLTQVADDDIILRLDAHTVYGTTYVAAAVEALLGSPLDVICIGCAQRPVAGTTFRDRLVGALYTNPMGLGGTDFRCGNDVREVDNIYLGAWRPGILTRLGGFNEAMEANEDAEMSARLRRNGYRILRVPLPCECFMKRGLYGTVKQWHRYGYWRAKMLRSNPEFTRRRHVVSPVAALLAVALACSPAKMLLVPLVLAYALLVYFYREKNEPLAITVATMLFFPAVQFGFALGMILGLLSGRYSEWPVSRSFTADRL